MIAGLLIILIILWLLGYIHISIFTVPDLTLFSINGQPITLWNILILFVIGTLIGVLPSPFREIAGVLLILWILSVLGIIAIAGLSNILIIAIILGLILFILKGVF